MTEFVERPRESDPLFPMQRPWLVGLLTWASFGLYLFFYLYVQARDLKRLGQPVRPWLWVFVPIVGIALPFATGRLTRRYQAVGESRGVTMRNRGALAGSLALLGFILSTVLEHLVGDFAAVGWLLLWPLIGLPFALVTADINVVKAALPQARFRLPHLKLTPGSWVWSGICGLLLVLMVYLGYEELAYLQRPTLEKGERWNDPAGRYFVEAPDAWSIAQIGSYSDGTAEAEFSLGRSGFVVIFDQKVNQNSAELGDIRRSEFHDIYPDGSCQETRVLVADTLERRSQLVCRARVIAQSALLVSTTMDDGEHMMELYAVAEGPRYQEEILLGKLVDFAAGFQYQPNSESAP